MAIQRTTFGATENNGTATAPQATVIRERVYFSISAASTPVVKTASPTRVAVTKRIFTLSMPRSMALHTIPNNHDNAHRTFRHQRSNCRTRESLSRSISIRFLPRNTEHRRSSIVRPRTDVGRERSHVPSLTFCSMSSGRFPRVFSSEQ